jgi:predicted permease
MSQLFRRLQYLFNRRRHDEELASELEFHREMAEANGRDTGNALLLREDAREAWGWTWIDRLAQDLRYAARMLAKSPAFTVGAILMLAIGIGVNVAVFSFFNMVMLRPLPIRDPETLLRFDRRSPNQYWSDVPYPAMAFYREHTRTLSAVIGNNPGRLTLEDGPAKPLRAQFVTGNYFSELGGAPAIGRLFDAARDEDPASELNVVLGNPFWKSHYASDPGIVNRVIRVNGRTVTVIGVAAADFSGLTMNQPDVWALVARKPELIKGSTLLTDFSGRDGAVDMWGRLREGLSAKAAEDELRGLAAELRKQQPTAIWENETLAAAPGGYAQGGQTNRGTTPAPTFRARLTPIFLLMGTLMFLILAVACANLGSLLLARGVARQREIAIRASVGAGRGRLVRQLLTESLLLASLGAAAGLVFGFAVLRIMLAWTESPDWLSPTPDFRVVCFAIAIGFLASLLFGLAPAMHVTNPKVHTSSHRFRHALIVAQVAASCVLLIVAGLLVRGVNHVLTASPGFEYEHVVTIEPRLSLHGYGETAARAYIETLASRLKNVAGVESVSVTATPPLGNRASHFGLERPGQPSIEVSSHRVDTDFFSTMRIPLLAGRNFHPSEKNVAIVSESLARLRWPKENPVGQKLEIDGAANIVVGLVASARLVEPENSDAVELYRPIDASDLPGSAVLVRMAGPPEGFAPFVIAIAKDIDSGFTPEVETMKRSFVRKLESTQKIATSASVLGGVALLLACLGIAGTVAYAVSQRTKEIGIRMALGAAPRNVASSMLRKFVWPVAAGLAIGAGGAMAISQYLRNQLYGLSNLDPVSYVAALSLFAAAALLAAYFPMRRALRVDPLSALRAD